MLNVEFDKANSKNPESENSAFSIQHSAFKKVAVVGAGMAGLAFSVEAAQRGHEIHLFEAAAEIGGQFNLAKRVPGKEDFFETLRYFSNMLKMTGVHLHLNTRFTPQLIENQEFSDIVLASGVVARRPEMEGINHPKVIFYHELLSGKKQAGRSVAIIGAGGIGFDVATFLQNARGETVRSEKTEVKNLTSHFSPLTSFQKEWGIDSSIENRGGLAVAEPEKSPREVWMLQRSPGKLGARLGKTTGWIHRISLKMKGLKQLSEVEYLKVDDDGLHILVKKEPRILAVDSVIICAGQESVVELMEPLRAAGLRVHVIGGAKKAVELDAKQAIEDGWRLSLEIGSIG